MFSPSLLAYTVFRHCTFVQELIQLASSDFGDWRAGDILADREQSEVDE